jgi:hypothetical protein
MNKPLTSHASTVAGASAADKPWAVTAAKVEAAVERIATAIRPVRILAFGSRARGDAGAESDLDLLVVLPKGRSELGVSSVAGHGPPSSMALTAWSVVQTAWARNAKLMSAAV